MRNLIPLIALPIACGLCACTAPSPRAGARLPPTDHPDALASGSLRAAAANAFALASLEPTQPLADLTDLRPTGQIRFLLLRGTADASPLADDVSLAQRMATRLAQQLGLTPRFVVASNPAALQDALLQGRGDVLIAATEPAPLAPAGATFSLPVRRTSIIVAVPKDRAAPRSLRDLARINVCVPENSLLANVASDPNLGLKHVQTVPLAVDEDDLLANVASGACAATLAYADSVARYAEVHDDLQVAFAIRPQITLAWLARSSALSLLQAINSATYDGILAAPPGALRGDLDTLRGRPLRFGMLNHGASYYLYRGKEVGFQYDMAALLAARLGMRLEVVVPRRGTDLLQLLADGSVDIAPISGMSNNPNATASEPFIYTDHVLVQPVGEAPIGQLQQLAGKTLTVRAGSSYFSLLKALEPEVHMHVVTGADDQDTEELIDAVGQHKLPYTVSGTLLLGTELAYRKDVQGTFVFTHRQPMMYGVRRDAPQLLQQINQVIKTEFGGADYTAIYTRYFADKTSTRRHAPPHDAQALSPYDDLARTLGRQYGIDWRLIVAQMYHESRFEPQARGWEGAVGLLQVLPETAERLGITANLEDPETNLRAGVQTLAGILSALEPGLDPRQRVRFALAGYTLGLGHLLDARRLARERGLDPNRWSGHVEQAFALLEKAKFAARTRHGYCRGKDAVNYVNQVQSQYEDYASIMPLEPSAAATR